MSQCEWNPVNGVPAMWPDQPGDCQNEATVSVGASKGNNYHLCDDCVRLPMFARLRKRVLPDANGARS